MTTKRYLNKKTVRLIVALFILIGGIIFYLCIREKLPGMLQQKEEDETPNVTNEMILIPAGDFVMGSSEKEIENAFALCKKDEGADVCTKADFEAEYPQQIITLPDFYIDKFEVSNGDYEKFAKATGRKSSFYSDNKNLNAPNQPVVGVSWQDAADYCAWAGKRLPTEAEWEKAARGTDGKIWSWGDEWDGQKSNHGKGGEPGQDSSDGYLYPTPVDAELGASPYGALNMIGNVAEWVADDFLSYIGNDKYEHENFGIGYKVFRGGSYIFTAADLRAASRLADDPLVLSEIIGFRCAK